MSEHVDALVRAVADISQTWNSLDDGRYVIEEAQMTALLSAYGDLVPGSVLFVTLDENGEIASATDDRAVSPAPVGEALREKAAEAAFNSGKADRGEEYGSVPWSDISGRHREGWLKIADAVLAVLNGEGER